MKILDAPASTAALVDSPEERTRYIAAILEQEERLSISGLLDESCPTEYLALIHDDRLSTIAVQDDALPWRYRLAVSAFRLAQYVQLGWVDVDAMFRQGLYHEPECGTVPDNSVHVITVDRRTGAIVGYVALYGQHPGSAGLLVSQPGRPMFPCEQAHNIRLFDFLENAELDTQIGHVWEVKRLVQRWSNATDRHLQMAATLHQFLGIFTALDRLGDRARWLIGDAQEHVAIKQLRMTVRDLTIFEGTSPHLSEDNLFWPLYTARKDVKPFAARVPKEEVMRELLDDLTIALRSTQLVEKLRILKQRTIKDVRRVTP